MVGHILWLIAISLAMNTDEVSTWVLVVSAVVAVVTGGSVFFARKFQQRNDYVRSMFLWCLPVLPVLMTICVLGVTYL